MIITMKKTIFLAAAALVMLAGCAKNEVTPVVNDNQQITYQAVVGKVSTKAELVTYKKDHPSFGTQAYYNADGETFPGGTPTLYIAESEVKYNATNNWWSTEVTYYWPKAGSGSLTFFSYSPYNKIDAEGQALSEQTDITVEGVKINDWNVNANPTTDVMVADVISKQTANSTNGGWTGVPTVFRHKLAQVAGFTIQTDKNYEKTTTAEDGTVSHNAGSLEFEITKVTIKGVHYEGDYDANNKVDGGENIGVWTPSDITDNYTWFSGKEEFSNSAKSVCSIEKGYLLVLPQVFEADANITIEYTIRHYTEGGQYTDEKATATILLSELHEETTPIANAWNINKKITYAVTVSMDPDEQILWAPSIEEWEPESIAASTPTEVTTEDELAKAVAAGESVVLKADIVLTEPVNVKATPAAKADAVAAQNDITIDLNGKTIKNTEDIWNDAENVKSWSLISVQSGNVTIKNGKLLAKENDCFAVDVKGGKVVILNGEFVGNKHAVYVRSGEAEIYGGKFSVQQKWDKKTPDGYVLNCRDEDREAGNAKITVYGGSYVGFNPANCPAEGEATNFLAEGYEATEKEGVWTVAKKAAVAEPETTPAE